MKKSIAAFLLLTVVAYTSCKKDAVKPNVQQDQNTPGSPNTSAVVTQTTSVPDTAGNNVNGYLKLQLAKDTVNTDNVIIEFNPSSKTTYVPGEDAPTLQGFGKVSLSSLSSNNIGLAINVLPLTRKGLKVGLKVNASADGVYKLQLLTIKDVPAMYDIWLKDNFKKDSLDMRLYPGYDFNIYKSDTSSFGNNRFKLVIRQK